MLNKLILFAIISYVKFIKGITMGQSYNIANTTKKTNFSESKMMEWSYIGCYTVEKVMTLLSKQWKKNKIVTAGDYSNDLKPYEFEESEIEIEIDYELSERGYIYNVSKLECINMKKYLSQAYEDGNIIHPLPLITKSEGGGGGGDYRNDLDPMIGAWSGDVLFTSYSKLQRYTDITHLVYHREERDFNDGQVYLDELRNLENLRISDKLKNF